MLGICFLNMASLFAQLKRTHPEIYADETLGRGFIEYVGWSSRSVLTNMHRSIVRIATDTTGRMSPDMLRSAARARYLNRFALAYLLTGVFALLAFAAWLSVFGRT